MQLDDRSSRGEPVMAGVGDEVHHAAVFEYVANAPGAETYRLVGTEEREDPVDFGRGRGDAVAESRHAGELALLLAQARRQARRRRLIGSQRSEIDVVGGALERRRG